MPAKRYCQRWTLFKDLLVIILGVIFGSAIVAYNYNTTYCIRIFKHQGLSNGEEAVTDDILRLNPLAHVRTSGEVRTTTPPPLWTLLRPKTLEEELKTKKPLLIGVVTAQTLLSTRATAVYKTWGALAPKILFFSSPGDNHGLPVVSLSGVDDTYPPQKKVPQFRSHWCNEEFYPPPPPQCNVLS